MERLRLEFTVEARVSHDKFDTHTDFIANPLTNNICYDSTQCFIKRKCGVVLINLMKVFLNKYIV